MTYDYELVLIGHGQVVVDDIGNQIETDPIETTVYCGLKSISRVEFYNAAQASLNPELIFIMHGYEYNGQKTIRFNDKVYRVIRTYSSNFEDLELVCEKVIGDE